MVELREGWEAAPSAPGDCVDATATATGELSWLPARVPGTAADVLRAAQGAASAAQWPLDEQDWWFRVPFAMAVAGGGEELVLVCDGVATLAEIYLNGVQLGSSQSMFAHLEYDIGAVRAPRNELAICCRALAPALAVSRRPRARWRTRLVAAGGLRFFRTMLIGRAPGFAPGPPIVGPWRAVRIERRRRLAVAALELRPRIVEAGGALRIRAVLRALGDARPDRLVARVAGGGGAHEAELELTVAGDSLEAHGEVTVAGVARWWPHTHGDPALYGVELIASYAGRAALRIDCGRVGFRELECAGEFEADGLQLRVNGEPVFVRGALWTPLEASGSPAAREDLRRLLEVVRDGGMNMLRIPGTGAYESPDFHDLCDELGILVWQDFMFANLDYPESDAGFMAAVEREAAQVLGELAGRPSLAVLCGSSEVAQQVAMLGLDPLLASGPLFGGLLPRLVEDAGIDAVYVPSAPSGGTLPFRPDRGVANYYGVGGYRRPLEDARRSGVRFAAECLAFANVPDQPVLDELASAGSGPVAVHDPRWKAGVPRDVGSGWDFDDVRDHYLEALFAVDPVELRRSDHERYLELSRAVSGEVMAEVFGEWRRRESSCGGGLVLWLRDLVAGAGWGVIDHRGEPKVAYHHLRRALAPCAVWSTDEGLSGIVAHVANDGPARLRVALRLALYRDFEAPVAEVVRELELAPHSLCEHNVEDLLGHFVDVSWAYRFGPPAQDVVALTLERSGTAPGARGEPLSQSFRLPAGRPLARETPARLGLEATLTNRAGELAVLVVRARRFAYGVRVHLPGYRADDDAFSVEPGGERRIECRPTLASGPTDGGSLTALNLAGHVPIRRPDVE